MSVALLLALTHVYVFITYGYLRFVQIFLSIYNSETEPWLFEGKSQTQLTQP